MALLVRYIGSLLKMCRTPSTTQCCHFFTAGQLFSLQIIKVHKNIAKQENIFTTQYDTVDFKIL